MNYYLEIIFGSRVHLGQQGNKEEKWTGGGIGLGSREEGGGGVFLNTSLELVS